MSVIKVAVLGFGTVGEGVYKTIQSHAEELRNALGKKVEVAAVLIRNKQKQRNISEDVLVTTDINEILALPKLDVVIEAIIDKEEPFRYLKNAIERGCHIVTANKEMFAHHGKELLSLAEQRGVSVGFEATVAGGIPVIQTLRQLLTVNRVQRIQGILNGTSNFILTEMREKKQSFMESLHLAQQKGYAEADPTNDVEGFDAFYKTMILSRIAFGEEPAWKDVERKGITSISSELIEASEEVGLRFKHIASITKAAGRIQGSVKPILVGKEQPFYHVEGVENAVVVHSDIVGRITLQGPGAGMFPTASAVIEDLVYVCQSNQSNKSYSQTTLDSNVDNQKQPKEYWLVYGLNRNDLASSVEVIQGIARDILIIKGAKKDVDAVLKKKQGSDGFLILDGENWIHELRVEKVKAL